MTGIEFVGLVASVWTICFPMVALIRAFIPWAISFRLPWVLLSKADHEKLKKAEADLDVANELIAVYEAATAEVIALRQERAAV